MYGRTEGDKKDGLDTTTPMVSNNILFCYEGESRTRNDSKRKQHFYNKNKNTVITRKRTRMDQKAQRGK